MKTTIAIDIDGVACDHASAICEVINEEFGIVTCVSDVTSWDHDFGPISFTAAVKKYYSKPDFIARMKVMPDFFPFLAKIRKKMDVIFASARNQYCHDATNAWVVNHFGPKCEVRFVENKIETDFDYLVDDLPKEIFAAAAKNRLSFLFSRPWNRNVKILSNRYIQRIETFDEILDLLPQ